MSKRLGIGRSFFYRLACYIHDSAPLFSFFSYLPSMTSHIAAMAPTSASTRPDRDNIDEEDSFGTVTRKTEQAQAAPEHIYASTIAPNNGSEELLDNYKVFNTYIDITTRNLKKQISDLDKSVNRLPLGCREAIKSTNVDSRIAEFEEEIRKLKREKAEAEARSALLQEEYQRFMASARRVDTILGKPNSEYNKRPSMLAVQ